MAYKKSMFLSLKVTKSRLFAKGVKGALVLG
jgi:hypothetical protein